MARRLQVAVPLALACLVGGPALAAPEGPPFYDRKRSLEAQNEAAKAAGEKAKGSTDPAELAALLSDESGIVRDRVFNTLLERDDGLLKALSPRLGDKDEFVSASVAELYGQKRWAAGREALEKAGLAAKGELTALESIWALEAIGDAASADALERAWKRRKEPRVRGDALIALATVSPATARPTVDEALKDANPQLRLAALVAMRAIDWKAAASAAIDVIAARPLEKREAVWEPRLLFTALETLARWTGRAGEKALVVRAVDELIARLPRESGLPLHALGLALADLTGAEGLEPDPTVWSGWWQGRREAFAPKDPPPPADKPKRRKPEAPPSGGGGGGGGEPAGEPKRQETGGGAGSRVRFHGIPVYSNRLVFAQDISGGMNNPLDKDQSDSPSKMRFSKDELVRVLKALPDAVKTNVAFFASECWWQSPQLVPLGKQRPQLIDFVNKTETPDWRQAQNRMKTRSNLYDTLAVALEDPELDTVYFLSEGGPNEGRWVDRERFLRHLGRLNVYQRVQVHTLQVTNDRAGAAFLERLAALTGGSFYDLDALKAGHP